jgi:NDP-sugar pyrophosphorylase family protein
MKAMILAAGLGTRLRPLTDDRPKALVEVAGHTLLEITLRRLQKFGVREVIVNVHHFADMVVDYLKKNDNFGMRIEISREDVLLDTGGGLKKAAWFLLENARSGHSGGREASFIVHNVDVLSTIDLARMMQFHYEIGALATLAVQDRKTSRHLLFDDHRQLYGRRIGHEPPEIVRASEPSHEWAFSGVHVISPRFLQMITEGGAFSIIDLYLRIAAEGAGIFAFRADEYYWRDLGKPENVAAAADDVKRQVLRL